MAVLKYSRSLACRAIAQATRDMLVLRPLSRSKFVSRTQTWFSASEMKWPTLMIGRLSLIIFDGRAYQAYCILKSILQHRIIIYRVFASCQTRKQILFSVIHSDRIELMRSLNTFLAIQQEELPSMEDYHFKATFLVLRGQSYIFVNSTRGNSNPKPSSMSPNFCSKKGML